LVKIGASDAELEIGDETEMYRHEKKFYHPTVLALAINDTASEDEQKAAIDAAQALEFDRVGQKIKLDALALRNKSGDAGAMEALAKRAMELSELPLIIMGDKAEVIAPAAEICKDRRPLIATATKDNLEGMASLAKKLNLPLCISADDIELLSELSSQAKEKEVHDIVLDLTRKDLKQQLEDLTIVRRMAIKSGYRPFGFPTLIRTGTGEEALLRATLGIPKYASIVITDSAEPELIYPLLTLRQNIYTDPQVPLQVEEKLYDIGAPKPESPLLMTTNFSLTYFTVVGDIEKSGVPSWLLVADTEGLSVMTAFAAGKLTAEGVAKLIDELKIKEKCTSGSVIIPGMISRMSGKLNELTGLEVVVGPRESAALPKFLKNLPR
jgi:acetyl-CoA decarbonylase/synthase complex subunit gamma